MTFDINTMKFSTIDIKTIEDFNMLSDADKCDVIHFVAAGLLVVGAAEYDIEISSDSLGFDAQRAVLMMSRFHIDNSVMDELIRRVVFWTNNSMAAMVKEIIIDLDKV